MTNIQDDVSGEQTLESHLGEALRIATEVAIDVGSLLRSYLESPDKVPYRHQADREAEDLIRSSLTEAFPSWGFRAEEAPELNKLVDESTPFWLVDPNDGTSAFLKGERGASVSIALISRGEPVLGVINAYAAPNGIGDLFTWARGVSPLKRNGSTVTPKWREDWTEATLFVSNSADRMSSAYQEVLDGAFNRDDRCHYRIAPGIAYRLALCAVGEGEVAISLASPRDFDFAAGHALLIGAGGTLLDERGEQVKYLHPRPSRLGFSFGGSQSLSAYAAALDWRPVFEAQKHPLTVPFLDPSKVELCSDEVLLNQVQGAWWGWHLGYALERHGLQSYDMSTPIQTESDAAKTLRRNLRRYGGDLTLIRETRRYVEDTSCEQELIHLPVFITTLQGLITSELPLNEQISIISDPKSGVRAGYLLGREALPSTLLSALLGWRTKDIETMRDWQPDGDRLVEQVIALSPKLRTARLSSRTNR